MIVFDENQWVSPERIEAITVETIDGHPQVILYLSGGHILKSKFPSSNEAHRKADAFAIGINQASSGRVFHD